MDSDRSVFAGPPPRPVLGADKREDLSGPAWGPEHIQGRERRKSIPSRRNGRGPRSLAGVQRHMWRAATLLEIKTAGLEASPAHHSQPCSLCWRRPFWAARRLSQQFPHEDILWSGCGEALSSSRVLRPQDGDNGARRQGARAEGEGPREPLCGMGGAPAPQGWGEVSKGLPSLLSPRGSMLAEGLLCGLQRGPHPGVQDHPAEGSPLTPPVGLPSPSRGALSPNPRRWSWSWSS